MQLKSRSMSLLLFFQSFQWNFPRRSLETIQLIFQLAFHPFSQQIFCLHSFLRFVLQITFAPPNFRLLCQQISLRSPQHYLAHFPLHNIQLTIHLTIDKFENSEVVANSSLLLSAFQQAVITLLSGMHSFPLLWNCE